MPDIKVLLLSAIRALGISVFVMFVLSVIYTLTAKEIMTNRWLEAVSVVMLFAAAGIFYLAAAWVCRSPEITELFAVIKIRTNRKC